MRRGSDKAEIYSIAFDKNSKWIACSSDKGTIHIFTVTKNLQRIQLSDENAKEIDELYKEQTGHKEGEEVVPAEGKKPKNSKHV